MSDIRQPSALPQALCVVFRYVSLCMHAHNTDCQDAVAWLAKFLLWEEQELYGGKTPVAESLTVSLYHAAIIGFSGWCLPKKDLAKRIFHWRGEKWWECAFVCSTLFRAIRWVGWFRYHVLLFTGILRFLAVRAIFFLALLLRHRPHELCLVTWCWGARGFHPSVSLLFLLLLLLPPPPPPPSLSLSRVRARVHVHGRTNPHPTVMSVNHGKRTRHTFTSAFVTSTLVQNALTTIWPGLGWNVTSPKTPLQLAKKFVYFCDCGVAKLPFWEVLGYSEVFPFFQQSAFAVSLSSGLGARLAKRGSVL